ncbi:hypothetical protein L1049_021070 [Liquidambar formosana]|uniref:RING-type domain-containing protein n=1 Tax=Liquidambar formosana TaxID=63359 RepID=A0AAP0SE21_LIQFO
MDDTCVVCAETLEWVAYGSCGHREVCSTCVSRLRFICDDRRCCLCKSESNVIFVTKVDYGFCLEEGNNSALQFKQIHTFIHPLYHVQCRQHPGQYEYFKNYDDLERHNAMEHGGNMSRSKRSAALQIPTSFRYRRSNELDHRGRRRGFRPDFYDNQLSLANHASDETANANMFRNISSDAQALSNRQETPEIDSIVGSFESLVTTNTEPSSGYRQAMGEGSRNVLLEGSSFPPLPGAPKSSKKKSKNSSKVTGGNTMAARLRRQNKVTVVNSSQAWSAASHQPTSSTNRFFPVKGYIEFWTSIII